MKKRYVLLIFIFVCMILFFFLWVFLIKESNNAIPEKETIQTEMEEVVPEETPFIVVEPYEEEKSSKTEAAVFDKNAGLSLPDGMEETIYGFLDTIYNYSTEERLYYQGTEKYMMQEAFRAFAPLQIEAEEEEEDDYYEPFSMTSRLLGSNLYYSAVAEEYIELLSIADFTFAASGDAVVTQILKLQVVETDGNWLISQVEVIDTIEQ